MITQSGAVTGVSIGQTTLSASSQGVTTALPISVVSATPTVHSVTLAGERHIKVGDPYVYSPTITMSDGSTATLPVTYTLNPTDAGNISASGILTALKTGIISVVATVNNVQFPTTVTSYDWSSGPGATTYSATLFADSAFTTTGPLLSPIPGLTIDCSQLDQPQSAFNIFATLSSVLAPGTTIQYSIDGGPVHTDDWLLASAAANRFAFPAPTAADRVAFAKALASGHTLKVTWTQSLQGPITGKFRLTGMATAIAPVLAACGFN